MAETDDFLVCIAKMLGLVLANKRGTPNSYDIKDSDDNCIIEVQDVGDMVSKFRMSNYCSSNKYPMYIIVGIRQASKRQIEEAITKYMIENVHG